VSHEVPSEPIPDKARGLTRKPAGGLRAASLPAGIKLRQGVRVRARGSFLLSGGPRVLPIPKVAGTISSFILL
jgi:hypothetical protein